MDTENIKDLMKVSSKAQLRWQCRRGMLELDLLLNLFLEKDFDLLTEIEQQHFEKILTFSDQNLYRFILNPSSYEPNSELPLFSEEKTPKISQKESLQFKCILERINKHASRRILSESLEEA